MLADGEGFEPSRRLRACRFSRPVPSTTRPPIQLGTGIIHRASRKSPLGRASRPVNDGPEYGRAARILHLSLAPRAILHKPMSRKPDPYGRDATRPDHIPLKGWWQVAQRVWVESGRDNLTVVSAGCAFYALFAVFPALSALIALYGLTTNPASVEQQFDMLS